MMRQHNDTRLLLFYLDQAFGRRGWHGPTLSAALRGVTVREAAWKPGPRRNSIWDLVLHAAFWKFTVRKRLDPARAGIFPRSPANFPSLPANPRARDWKADVALLRAEHQRLVSLVERFPPAGWHRKIRGTRYVPVEQVAGIAAHDLYHCGQVSLSRKLYESA